ncbi:MAG: hypothetical protein GXO79_10690 [Chlorobi bacterium]|nr:hypothetical protein [Chlorobiota bacterium]
MKRILVILLFFGFINNFYSQGFVKQFYMDKYGFFIAKEKKAKYYQLTSQNNEGLIVKD